MRAVFFMTKHLVSLSGGKDSTATLLLALELHGHENVLAAFADTGNEHPATYEYVRYLHRTLGVPIQWLKRDLAPEWWARLDYVRDHWPDKGVPQDTVDAVVRFMERGPTGNPFLDICIIKSRFPSRRTQFCTQWLKTEPLTEYALELIEAHGQVWSWQGIRLDESHSRRSRLQGTGACVRSYEFVGGGLHIMRPILRWKAADVFDAHRAWNVDPNPLYLQGADRVGCMPCINAGKDEILNISKRWPEHIERIAEWERIVGMVSKRGNATFFPSPGDNDTAYERGNVWKVVEWSKTKRGGKELDLFRVHDESPACASSFGLCEHI